MIRKLVTFSILVPVLNLAIACMAHAEIGPGFQIPEIKLPIFRPATAEPAVSNGMRLVTGAASKGPMAGATVDFYEVDDRGGLIGSPVATATTDGNGNFTVTLPATSSALLVKTSGGSFVDESDQNPNPAARRRVSFGSNEGLWSAIKPSQSTVAITPITTSLVQSAIQGGRLGNFDSVLGDHIDGINSDLGFNVFTTIPANPTAPAAGSSTAELQYALLLGATANLINRVAIHVGKAAPDYDVIEAVIKDMSDGNIDGVFNGSAVTVNGRALPTNSSFGTELLRFRNNNYAHYSGVALPDTSTTDDRGGLGFPLQFFAIEAFENPVNFGLKHLPYGKISLNNDGSGSFMDGHGAANLLWAGGNGHLVIDFTQSGGKESFSATFFQFNSSTNTQEEATQTTYLDRIEFEIDNGIGSAREVGRLEVQFVQSGTVEVHPFDHIAPIRVIGRSNVLPIPAPETFEEEPALPHRTNERDERQVGVDRMTFNTDGTGTANYTGHAFTWQHNADGTLSVSFSNGDEATYYYLLSDDVEEVDYIAADYFDGEKLVHTGSVVFSNSPELDFININAAGIAIVESQVVLEDGSSIVEPLQYRTHPNGTGLGEFRFYDFSDGDWMPFPSSYVICWDVDSTGLLHRKRTYLPEGTPGYGPLPSPQYCQNLQNSQIEWSRVHEFFDDGDGFQTVIQEYRNECYLNGSGNCNALFRQDSFPARYSQFIAFTANPPITQGDFVHSSPGETITINPLANDITGDLAIDPGSLEIVSGPLNMGQFITFTPEGSVSIDASTGLVTFTSDGSITSDRPIWIAYRVKDVDGNISNSSVMEVYISSAQPEPEPEPPTASGSYFGTYNWDCGFEDANGVPAAGSASIVIDLQQNAGEHTVQGKVDYLGGQSNLTGNRYTNVVISQFGGFESGDLDPNGEYISFNWPEVPGIFVHNGFSGMISGTGMNGYALNGDSPTSIGPGCSHADSPSGMFDLTKQ